MNNSKIINVLIGLICSLFIVAGVVWFFVYWQHQKGQDDIPQTVETPTAVDVVAALDPPDVSMPTATSTPTTPTPQVTRRLGDPANSYMVASPLANELGITKENYPRIDGSTSTFPLVSNLYWAMFVYPEDETFESDDFEGESGMPIAPAKTIPSYKDLIAGDVDLIIVPDPSQEVKDLEKESGIELEYVPIGREGLVFLTPEENPVSNITKKQINQIYADMTITNWSQLGGLDGEIWALCRNDESGSQAQFDNLAMEEGNTINPVIKEKYTLDEMDEMVFASAYAGPLWINGQEEPRNNRFPLGYSIYYYVQMVKKDGDYDELKVLSVDGIMPTPDTIASDEYPLAMGYFAVLRKDTPQDAPARKIANWLVTPDGQQMVADSELGKVYQ